MYVDHDKEHRSAVGMDIAHHPAPLDVAHDMLGGDERMIDMSGVMHGQNHTGDDLHHQHDPGERAEIPPIVQITRRRIDD